jgi:hypothetical protein
LSDQTKPEQINPEDAASSRKKEKKQYDLPLLKKEKDQLERNREKLMSRVQKERISLHDYFGNETGLTGEFSSYIDQFLLDPSDEAYPLPMESDPVPAAPNDWKLIDDFIHQQPRISPPNLTSQAGQDISGQSNSEPDDFITETLIRIYIEQRLYDKAIKAYEKLSLKYPKKSIYFADQIKGIEALKNK